MNQVTSRSLTLTCCSSLCPIPRRKDAPYREFDGVDKDDTSTMNTMESSDNGYIAEVFIVGSFLNNRITMYLREASWTPLTARPTTALRHWFLVALDIAILSFLHNNVAIIIPSSKDSALITIVLLTLHPKGADIVDFCARAQPWVTSLVCLSSKMNALSQNINPIASITKQLIINAVESPADRQEERNYCLRMASTRTCALSLTILSSKMNALSQTLNALASYTYDIDDHAFKTPITKQKERQMAWEIPPRWPKFTKTNKLRNQVNLNEFSYDFHEKSYLWV